MEGAGCLLIPWFLVSGSRATAQAFEKTAQAFVIRQVFQYRKVSKQVPDRHHINNDKLDQT